MSAAEGTAPAPVSAVDPARGLDALLAPRSVAVVGASRTRGTISGEVFHNLLAYGSRAPVIPVNPRAPDVQGVRAYPDVESIPGPVDLGVVVVPAAAVLEVAAACARKGVRALVVISAGFAETGAAGRARQEELLRICRAAGMRLVGPNCMGVLNTDPAVRLNATFAPAPPPPGRVAFMSQSGALGLAVIDYAGMLGLGLSSFVSVGNKADVSGNDLVEHWETDPATDVILLYLESFGNPRRFSTIARRVTRAKPIVVVKSGRSPAGARAAGSHTGALLGASDVTVDALFRQTGVIRTDSLHQMFDVATLLASQRPPRGRRVAILTNAGGPGIMCADTCVAEGLEVPLLAEETQRALRAVLPGEASVANPVDLIASASADQYREALRIVGRDPGVDALIVIFVPPLVTRADDVAHALIEGARTLDRSRTLLTVFMQARGIPDALRAPEVRIPSFAFPEEAALALARVARWGEWRARPAAAPERPAGLRPDQAEAAVAAARARGAEWLDPDEVARVLRAYGLPALETRTVATPEEAEETARAFGGGVALKAIAPGLVHKTETGAVRLDLAAAQVSAAARTMAERLAEHGLAPTGYLVQRMAPAGIEMLVGVVHDRRFGPVVACGAGGVLVELVKDLAVRLTPIARAEAHAMIDELRVRPLLSGYRGGPLGDVDALADVIVRVGALVDDLPQIAELDLNPVRVHERGATIVDARIRVAAAHPA